LVDAPARTHSAQEVLKPRQSESLGKVLHRFRLARRARSAWVQVVQESFTQVLTNPPSASQQSSLPVFTSALTRIFPPGKRAWTKAWPWHHDLGPQVLRSPGCPAACVNPCPKYFFACRPRASSGALGGLLLLHRQPAVWILPDVQSLTPAPG